MTSTLTVLGSCGAWPEPGRACSGFVLEHDGYRVVLDLGYGAAGRLFELLGASDGRGVDAVVISHRHPDHAVDLHALFRARWFGARGEAPLPVYAADGVREVVLALEDGRPDAVDTVFTWRRLPGAYDVGPLRLTSYGLPHWVPNAGVRLECDRFVLAYSGDTGPCDELTSLARGADLFVCEASDRQQRDDVPPAPETGLHLDARAAAAAAVATGARRLLLTHFWPGNDRELSRRRASQVYDGPIELADEGLVLTLP